MTKKPRPPRADSILKPGLHLEVWTSALLIEMRALGQRARRPSAAGRSSGATSNSLVALDQMQKWPAGMDVGGGLKKTPQICSLVEIHKKEKKRSSKASWKHAALELLSPDLRCFYTHLVEKVFFAQEYLKTLALSNR
jgi:hypothetical protein